MWRTQTLAGLHSTAEEKRSIPPAPSPLPPCFSLTISTLCNKNTVCEDRKKLKKKHPYTAKSGVSEVYFFSGSVVTKLPSPPSSLVYSEMEISIKGSCVGEYKENTPVDADITISIRAREHPVTDTNSNIRKVAKDTVDT